MSSTIFDVPFAAPTYNPENDTLMIHNLNQPAGSSTVQIKITDLLNKFVLTDGKIKVRLIDNGEESLPFINGDTFTVAFNEIVIFRSSFAKNHFDQMDGYRLQVFTKGKGKYRRPGFVDPTAIQVSVNDFIEIYKTSYADEIYPGTISIIQGINYGMLNWSTSTDFSIENHETVSKYLQRIYRDAHSKLNIPIIDFTWGGKGDEENRITNPTRNWIDLDGNPQQTVFGTDSITAPNLLINKLGIKIHYWESFQAFIDNGGQVELLIYRRRHKKRSLNINNSSLTKRKPVRWALNTKAENFGGKHKILITQKEGFYDINPEFFLRKGSQRRDYIDGKLPRDEGGRKVRREWLGFAFKFSVLNGSQNPFITPIIKTLGVIKTTINDPDSNSMPETSIGTMYNIIGYQYQ